MYDWKQAVNNGLAMQVRVVASTANTATPAINTDLCDIFAITGQSVNITSFTSGLVGSPQPRSALIVEITDAGSPVTLAWGASFEPSTVPLPTTTVAGAMLAVGFLWNPTTSAWRCIGVA
jgi:hypothetical protein